MSAWRAIYRAAGSWNDHVGRLVTIAWWLALSGAACVVVGGLLYRTYGLLGAIAILGGCLMILSALTAKFIDRRSPSATAIPDSPTLLSVAASNTDGSLQGLAQRGIDQLNLSPAGPLTDHRLRAAQQWAAEVRDALSEDHPGAAVYFDGLADGNEPRQRTIGALQATLHPLVQRLLYLAGSPEKSDGKKAELVRDGAAVVTPAIDSAIGFSPANVSIGNQDEVNARMAPVWQGWYEGRKKLLTYLNTHPSDEIRKMGHEAVEAVTASSAATQYLFTMIWAKAPGFDLHATYEDADKKNTEAVRAMRDLMEAVRAY